MKLESRKPDITVQPQRPNLDWSSKSYLELSPPKFQPDTWVHLLELPSRFSFDEALLICQLSEDEWIAWIPDHGEAILNARQFRPLPCYP